ncbi:DNA mismatch repair protein MutT, partial [Bacillus cereus]|nr:DNA mismatch repair protein MutT [Bacillus cereus]
MKILNIKDEETVAYAKWITITAFIQKEKILYPDGVLKYI